MSVSISTNTMNSFWKFALLSFFFLSTLIVTAQTEICNNGVDDDGDGRVDCYDGDCSNSPDCEDFFFGNTVVCADEINVTTFAIREQWKSANETATSHTTPAIGDLDGNGIPEVISVNNYSELDLFVLNGATGATIASADIGFTPENAPMIADIDRDEVGEIFVSQNKGDDMAMYRVDIATGILTQIWRRRASLNEPIGVPGLADFDQDGDVEIYYRNEVMDAATGNVIIAGDGDWENDYTHGSLAVDVLPDSYCADCAGLELISGNEIWAINEATGTRTLVEDMDDDIHDDIASNLNYYPKYYPDWDDQWSSVSAADYNLDGNIDILLSGALGTSSQQHNGETTIFFWDVINQNVITYHDPTNNFVRGPGRINIGDVDGDGLLNANFVMDQKLYSLDENFNVHWIHPIKEGSSGFTGCSLFDFDGDGAVEVVYRSEESLLIVDGVGNGDNTTSERREIACVSRTQEEYPVVADVDGDGSSEICVSCYFDNNTPFNPYDNTQFASIRVYESDGEAWMPARGVWNQHGYYNVNINDDLTIPEEVQDHSVVFSSAGECQYADGTNIPFDNRPLNTFINQAPILNEDGCVEFASPDIDFVGILSATDADCPDAEITVDFAITNIGDIDISGNLPVSYYAGDPTAASAATTSQLLDTEVTLLENFEVGETLTITQTIDGIGGDFELFVVINDNGTSNLPIIVPLPTATVPECNTDNNIQSTQVGFQTFDLTVEKLSDNRRCNDTIPNNASARAYYLGPTPGSEGVIWNENFEGGDIDLGDTEDTGETAWISSLSGGNADFFGVASYNSTQMFGATRAGGSGNSEVVRWASETIDISQFTDIIVSVDLFENGNMETSGNGRDWIEVSYSIDGGTSFSLLNNGQHIGNFGYARAIVGNINAPSIIIQAEIHNTGGSETHYIDNIVVEGTSLPVIKEHTEIDGFTFDWYESGDFAGGPIYTGSQFNQIPDGTYDVVGYFATTECYSDTIPLTITSTPVDVFAWAYEVSPETNCENPNGVLAGFVYTTTNTGDLPADPANGIFPLDSLYTSDGYGFTWTITSDGTDTPIGIGDTIRNLSQINDGYTVTVIEDFTGCSTTANADVTSSLIRPVAADIDTVVTHVTTCGGLGEISASVAGNTTDFTFYWYDGIGTRPTPDFIGSTYSGLTPGIYSVTVEENGSECVSSSYLEVEVRDDSEAPVLTASETQPNGACGLNPTGVAEATVNGIVGSPGFDYTWYQGVNTLPENEIPSGSFPSAAFGAGEWEMTGLRGGIYTIVVEETATTCTDTITVEITDDFTEPEFNLNSTIDTGDAIDIQESGYVQLPQLFGAGNPVTNGLTISYWANFSSANYSNDHRTFSSGATGENQVLLWSDNHDGLAFVVRTSSGGRGRINSSYSANGWTQVTGTWDGTTGEMKLYANGVLLGETNHIGSGVLINAGPNMFIGQDNNPGYGKFDGEIDELRIFDRALTATEINQYLCAEGLAGDESGLVAYYNFDNIVGNTVPDETTAGSSHDGTIQVPGTGGVTSVPADIQCPIADAIANTSCGTPNGSVNLSGFITPATGNYTYTLYEGFSTDVFRDSNTTGLFEGLEGGFYTLTAIDDATTCITPPVTISIPDIPDLPNIFTVVTDDSFCINGNGQVVVTSSANSGEPSSYTYEIFNGFNTDPINLRQTETVSSGLTGFTFTGLENGNYRIRVINDDLTCDNFTDIVVDDISEVPAFSTSRIINDNTSCDSNTPNGFLSISIDEIGFDPTDYTFEWYEGSTATDPTKLLSTPGSDDASVVIDNYTINPDGNSISGLPEGNYTVFARDNETGCRTVELTLPIIDDPVRFDIVTSSSPQTSCSFGNGNVRAGVDGTSLGLPCTNCVGSDGFTFEWFFGNDTSNPLDDSDVGGNGTLAFNSDFTLAEGLVTANYTVRVTENNSQCTNTQTIFVNVNSNIPDLNASTTPNSVCDDSSPTIDFNGTLTVTGTDDNGTIDFSSGDFEIEVFEGVGTGGTSRGVQTVNTTFGQLEDGPYTVVVRNTLNGCVSNPETFTVSNSRVNPTVTASVSSDDTSCVTDNGQINITTSDAIPAAGYEVRIYTGTGTSNLIEDLGTQTTFVPVITSSANLGQGTYTVEVFNNETGCSATDQVTINEVPDESAITSAVPTDDTFCIDDNGTIAVTASNVGSNPTFNIYAGGASDGTPDSVSTPGASSYTWSQLPMGTYTVTVTKDESGCESDDVVVIVGETLDDFSADVTSIVVTNEQSACDLNSPTGQITATVASSTAGYDFQLFNGNNTNSVNEITTNITINSTTVLFDSLANGEYTVLITSQTSGCTYSELENVTTNRTDPVLASPIATQPNTRCDNPDGEITATAQPGPGAETLDGTLGYRFELFRGTAINPSDTPLETVTNIGTPATATFQNYEDDDYIVRITDIATKCEIEEAATIGFTGFTIDVNESFMSNSPLSAACFDSDGTLDIGAAIFNITSGYTGDIEITWYVGTDTSDASSTILALIPGAVFSPVVVNDLGSNPVTILNGNVDLLPAVSYTGVIELSNGCIYLINTDLSIVDAPDLALTPTEPTSCSDPSNGSINIQITPNSGNNAGFYDYFVFEGSRTITGDQTPGSAPFDPPLDDPAYAPVLTSGSFTNNGANVADDVDVNNLNPGLYTIAIRINDGDECITNVRTITLEDPELPTITLNTFKNNEICGGGGDSYDGSITIDADHPNGAFTDDFNFTWFVLDGTNYIQLNDGDGTVLGDNDYDVTIANSAGPASSSTISGIGENQYRVVATHVGSTCGDTLDIEIFDDPTIYTVNTVTQNDQDDCNGFGNFELDVLDATNSLGTTQINDVAGAFTLTWQRDGVAFAPDSEDQDADLGPGVYEITGTHDATGCPFSYSFEIEDVTEDPVINLTGTGEVDNTVCVGGPNLLEANGSITIEITEGGVPQDPAGYTIEWYLNTVNPGVTDIPANEILGASFSSTAVDFTIGDLPGGTYLVSVTDNTGINEGCESIGTFMIEDSEVEVSIQQQLGVDFTIQHQEDCTPVDGSITLLNVYEGGVADPVSNGNYIFNWYTDDTGTTSLNPTFIGGAFNETVSGLSADTYFVEAVNTNTDCVSGLVAFEIDDNTVDPVILIAQDAVDIHCNPTTGTGGLTASVDVAGYDPNNYTFTWYEGGAVDPDEQLTSPVGVNVDATTFTVGGTNGEQLTGLPNGTYTVEVTDGINNLGCVSVLVSDVPENQQIPTLSLSGLEVVADSLCGVPTSGSFTIDDTDFSVSNISDYTITTEKDGVGSGDIRAGTFVAGAPSTLTFDNLEPGSYFITADNTITGCSIAPVRVDIADDTRLPLVTLERVTPDQACTGGTTNAGELEVLVDGQFDHISGSAFLTFLWEADGGGALPVPVTDNEATLSDVPAGDYQVTVTNTNTGCISVRSYTVPNEPVFPAIISSEVNNNTVCVPPATANGSFVMLSATYDGQLYDVDGIDGLNIDGEFSLSVFRRSDDLLQGAAVTNVPYEVTGLVADNYYAVITHAGSNCPSEEFDFTIEENPFFPVIELTIDAADSTCVTSDGVNVLANGTLSALADGRDDTDGNYDFTWFYDPGAGPAVALTDGVDPGNGSIPLGANASTISGLAAGTYIVEVMESVITGSGCTSTAQIILPNVPTEVEIIAVTVDPSSSCDPVENGRIVVDEVQINGNTDDVLDYSFAFFDVNPNNAGATPVFTVPNDGAEFNTAVGGTTYFIVGTHQTLGCSTPVFQVQVEDDRVFPVLRSVVSSSVSTCDPNNGNGSMTISLDIPSTPALDSIIPAATDYTINWYFGTNTSNPLDVSDDPGLVNLAGLGTATVTGLVSGNYTFEVIDNLNGMCSLVETEFLPGQTGPGFDANIDVINNFNCINPNGSLNANSNPRSDVALYDFYWYDELTVNPDSTLADSVGNLISNLPAGDYTFLVVEKADRYCQLVLNATIIDDNNTNMLQYELTTENVTVCFDEKDGFAQVAMVGADSARSIATQWFNSQGDQIGTSNSVSNLAAGTYRLVLTDSTTGCITTDIFDIIDESVLPNPPFVLVNNGRTNCSFANGNAIANVDGVTNNFLFEWFDPADMSEPYATGAQVFNLDTATYLVYATDLNTGCRSEPTQVEIGYEVVDPTFEVQFNNSVCLRTEDGSTNQFTGTAIVSFTEFNLATDYRWVFDQTGEVVGTASRLIDAFPGDYTVFFIAANGCEYQASFTIETSLTIYNGVSANDDGKNDFFLVDCIDYFPDNNVKIFNRAGQRIFEVDGYNNTSVRWDGISNVGGGGLQLPSGTYFYVIELGNGEDPVQGYIELVR